MCDCLCALPPASATGVTIFAKNSDRPPTEPQVIEWHPSHRDVARIRATHIEIDAHAGETIGFVGSRPTWMWGVEHGVNEAGVAAGNETINTTHDPRDSAPGLIGMDLVRLALERAATAETAVDVVTAHLERYGQGGTGHRDAYRPYWSSFLIADAASAFVVETSGRSFAVEQAGDVRAISNRTTIPSFDAEHRHPRQPVATLVDPRWRASQAVLARAPVSIGAVRDHLRSHVGGDEGWTVCMHVEGVEATTASIITELPVGRRAVARLLLGSPCTSVFVPIVIGHPLGEVPAWERFAALTADDRPALDALEADLERDVTDDPAWNAEAWRRITTELESLSRP
jgi:hypothetical protein